MADIAGLNVSITTTGATESAAQLDALANAATRAAAATDLAEARIAAAAVKTAAAAATSAARVELLQAKAAALVEATARKSEEAAIRIAAANAKIATSEEARSLVEKAAADRRAAGVASRAKVASDRAADAARNATLEASNARPLYAPGVPGAYAGHLNYAADSAAAARAAVATRDLTVAETLLGLAVAKESATVVENVAVKTAAGVATKASAAEVALLERVTIKAGQTYHDTQRSALGLAKETENLGSISGRTGRSLIEIIRDVSKGNFSRVTSEVVTLGNNVGFLPKVLSAVLGPLGLVIAGFAVFGAGVVAAQREEDKYNRSLLATGGFAATTASEIKGMAERFAGSSVGIGKAREGLDALVASGRFSREEIKRIGDGVIAMADVTGEKIDTIVGDFAKLKDEPVKAAVQLNEKYHFLTESIYLQIDALVKHGDKIGATVIAQDALSAAMQRASSQVDEEAGYLIRAAKSVQNAWETTWEAIKNVGKAGTASGALDTAQANIAQARLAQQETKNGGSVGISALFSDLPLRFTRSGEDAALQAYIKEQQKVVDKLTPTVNALAAAHDAEGKAAEKAAEGVTKLAHANDLIRKYDKKADYRDNLIDAKASRDFVATDPSLNETDRTAKLKDLDAAIVQIQKDYDKAGTSRHRLTDAEKAAKKLTNEQNADYKSLNQQLDNIITKNDLIANQSKKPTGTQDALAILAKEIEGQKALAPLERTKLETKWALANASMMAADAAEAEAKAETNVTSVTGHLTRETLQLNKTYKERLDYFALGKKALEQERALDEISLRATEARNALMQKDNTDVLRNTKAHIDGLAAITKAEQEQLAAAKDYYAKQSQYEKSWSNGFQRAISDLTDQASNVSDNVYNITTNAYNGMANSLQSLVNGGKAGFKDLAISVLKDIEAMIIKMLILKAVSAFLNSFGGGPQITDTGVQLGPFANGAAFSNGEVTPFASGGIVSRPTLFPMARGSGLMGEAGPEAIMPLTRIGGVLGVRSTGTSGSGTNISIQVNVDSSGGTTATSTGEATQQGRQLAEAIKIKVVQEIINQKRPGGMLYAGAAS
jgi:lambda family phage tail tape measure protein